MWYRIDALMSKSEPVQFVPKAMREMYSYPDLTEHERRVLARLQFPAGVKPDRLWYTALRALLAGQLEREELWNSLKLNRLEATREQFDQLVEQINKASP